jgi:hypothetical protein
MKRTIIVFTMLLYSVATITAAPSLLGKWKVLLVDPADALIFEFFENDIFSISSINSDEEPDYYKYSYDLKKNSLSLGELFNTEYSTRIEWVNEKYFRLYFSTDMSDSLVSEMGLNIPDPEDPDTPMNTIGKSFISQFLAGIIKLLTTIPIAEGRKL